MYKAKETVHKGAILVLHKNKVIGEAYPCEDNQWGYLHYKSDQGARGLANTTLQNTIEDIAIAEHEHTGKEVKYENVFFVKIKE